MLVDSTCLHFFLLHSDFSTCFFLSVPSREWEPDLTAAFQVRRQMAAALASVLIASGLPAVAQEPAMVPTAPTQEISAPAAAGGIQNWRYSEFITAVEKDKVEKVIFLSPCPAQHLKSEKPRTVS